MNEWVDKLNQLMWIGLVLVVVVLLVVLGAYFLIKHLLRNKKGKVEDSNKKEHRDIYELFGINDIIDNMIILDKGYTYLMVLRVVGSEFYTNFEDEQFKVIKNYTEMFNLVKKPLQFHIQTRVNDISYTIERYRRAFNEIEYKLEALVGELERLEKTLEKLDKSNEEGLRVLEIEKRKLEKLIKAHKLQLASIDEQQRRMTFYASNKDNPKKFQYYILEHTFSGMDFIDDLEPHEIRERAYRELSARAGTIITSLSKANATATIIDEEELEGMMIKHFKPRSGDKASLTDYFDQDADVTIVTSNSYKEYSHKDIMSKLGVM